MGDDNTIHPPLQEARSVHEVLGGCCCLVASLWGQVAAFLRECSAWSQPDPAQEEASGYRKQCLEAAERFCVNAVLGASPILPRRKLLGIANSAWRRLLTSPWRQVAAFSLNPCSRPDLARGTGYRTRAWLDG